MAETMEKTAFSPWQLWAFSFQSGPACIVTCAQGPYLAATCETVPTDFTVQPCQNLVKALVEPLELWRNSSSLVPCNGQGWHETISGLAGAAAKLQQRPNQSQNTRLVQSYSFLLRFWPAVLDSVLSCKPPQKMKLQKVWGWSKFSRVKVLRSTYTLHSHIAHLDEELQNNTKNMTAC